MTKFLPADESELEDSKELDIEWHKQDVAGLVEQIETYAKDNAIKAAKRLCTLAEQQQSRRYGLIHARILSCRSGVFLCLKATLNRSIL